MTATIHTLHGEVQAPREQISYFDFVHKSVLAARVTIEISRGFAQLVIDESLKSENKYLAEEALTFLKCLDKIEKGRMA